MRQNMQKIYKLNPTLHNNIWGGNKLREYGKESTEDRIGESWELSFVKGDAATTESGVTTLEAFPKSTWGRKCEGFDNFPVLTKFIDAKENLSVQVHPDDSYALK
jgi:mannose-6-phosphate isomerase